MRKSRRSEMKTKLFLKDNSPHDVKLVHTMSMNKADRCESFPGVATKYFIFTGSQDPVKVILNPTLDYVGSSLGKLTKLKVAVRWLEPVVVTILYRLSRKVC